MRPDKSIICDIIVKASVVMACCRARTIV
jgi:hypothetical protein